ncbi:MAG: response regulator [Oscillibacter sp.]|nr:response regulator [Oscillibacter sp.]
MERILVVDDEPMNLKLTKFILENADYEVVTAESGMAGIELLQEIPFDLLLLDIEMPDMDGLEVLRRIRNIPAIAKTKVIFLTASNSQSDLTDAARLHAARFVQKPCLPEVLLRVVREAFEETTASLLLIVDDEPMSRALTKNAFESLFRVECVSSGQEALSFLQESIPDMILMDLYMPGMDGLETFLEIRKLDNCRHLPVIFMTAADDNATELELFQAGAVDFIRKPFIAEIARERVKRILELQRLQNFLHEEVDRRTAQLLDSARKVKRLTKQIIFALAGAIDAKDAYTNGHSSRVAEYSREIARRMGKDEEEIEDIYYAAMLHDVGKIGIPRDIIGKTSQLTEEEFEVIREHTVKGEKILKTISELPRLSIGARWHHERYDGGGYPDGLSGNDIPEIARIICVADCYDAMSSNRCYRKALSQRIVRDEILRGRGTQFDPIFADIMLAMIDEDTRYRMREM